MDLKYIRASFLFAALGVVSSVVGLSLTVPADASAPLSSATSDTQTSKESTPVLCSNASDTFTLDDAQVLASAYANVGTADCLFVGCGGII